MDVMAQQKNFIDGMERLHTGKVALILDFAARCS